jgi:hypothetical protein
MNNLGIKILAGKIEKPTPFVFLTLGAVLLFLLFLRRADALLYPSVWSEDGVVVLPSLLYYAVPGLFTPVSGYMILSSKIISGLSLLCGVQFYPTISSLLALLYSFGCVMAVWLCPTNLKYKFFCALGCVLIPTDPECFGTPLYSFWWSGLLLILLVLWNADGDRLWLRLSLLLLAGFSSPLVVALAPFFIARAILFRFSKQTKKEWIIGILATGIAAIQFWFIMQHKSDGVLDVNLIIQNTIPKFLGGFVVWPIFKNSATYSSLQWIASILLIAFFAKINKKWTIWLWALIIIYGLMVALSVTRVSPQILHPVLAGPRYFFYPFIILFWLTLYTCYNSISWNKLIPFLAYCLAAAGSLFSWDRHHENIHWREHIISAHFFETYPMPVSTDGKMHTNWHSEIYHGSAIPWNNQIKNIDLNSKSFPFKWAGASVSQIKNNSENSEISQCTIFGSDSYKSKIDGVLVSGTFVKSDQDTGNIEVKMKKGGKLLFRTGPFQKDNWAKVEVLGQEATFLDSIPTGCLNWTVLEFSNKNLPPEFIIRLSDNGTEFGEWLAVGTPIEKNEK